MSAPLPLHLCSTVVAGDLDQDRVALFQHGAGAVLALADGAGGRSGGGEAANKAVLDLIQSLSGRVGVTPKDCVKALEALDKALYRDRDCGETTAVVVIEEKGQLLGASLGDSEAWLVSGEGKVVLTKSQVRRPFLGSGAARSRAFGPIPWESGRLLIASDGLFKYVDGGKIQEALRGASLEGCLGMLVDLGRLKSGRLQDDCAIILAERSSGNGELAC